MKKYRYDVRELLFPVNDCNFYVQELESEDGGDFEYKGKGFYFKTEAEAKTFALEKTAQSE